MSLGAGSIAFTGYNADTPDNLSFVVLQDVAAGTVIYFTDSEWEGSDFAAGESTLTWTAAADIAAGTTVTLDSLRTAAPVSNLGTVTFEGDLFDPGDNNDAIFAYFGSADAPTFLAAIANQSFSAGNSSLAGTGLVKGLTALDFSNGVPGSGADVLAYNGPRSGFSSFEDYLAAINNPLNWIFQDGRNLDTDGIPPDVPFNAAPFRADPSVQTVSFDFASHHVEKAEGNSGATSITFTVHRTGSTTGAVDFSGSFAGGGTSAADFGGFAFSSFAGTIADGESSATVTITLTGDTAVEPDEKFTLTLQSATNAGATVVLGAANALTATGTIVNDDFVHTHIAGGETATDSIEITSGDTLKVDAGGALQVDGDAVLLTEPLRGAVVDNAGLIEAAGRAIYTDGFFQRHDVTIINREGGVIRSTTGDDTISFDAQRGAFGDIVIDNAGRIESDGRALDMPKTYSTSVTIFNRETGVIWSENSDAMRPGDSSIRKMVVWNDGLIHGGGDDAVDLQEGEGTVHNGATGVIEADNNGIGGDASAIITNAAGGIVRGHGGSGVNFDGGTITVRNFGFIGGGGSDGDGVDIDDYAIVTNYGEINGSGGIEAEGIAAGRGRIVNQAGGTIYGEGHGILVDDSDGDAAFGQTAIVNRGSITSFFNEGVKLIGDWNDTFRNDGMVIGGNGVAIDMGGGNDLVTLNAGSLVVGTILLGDGDDKIVGSAGNEKINGGTGADLIIGGGGTDLLSGGGDGDTFQFGGAQVDGVDAAYITDLSFDEGDMIRLVGFEPGTFAGLAGANPLSVRPDGSGATIDSFTDLKELDAASDLVSADGSGNDIVVSITGADGVLQIRLVNASDAFYNSPEPTDIIGTSGNDFVKGTAGDESLFGLEGDDRIQGGSGDDVAYGGTGADKFVYLGSDAPGAFWDNIQDLSFAEGDTIEFRAFGDGTFDAQAGGNPLQVSGNGATAILDSFADLVELNQESDAVTVTRLFSTNHLTITIDEGGGEFQSVVLADSWSSYLAAGGLV
jgi:hypothetical protein